MGLGHDCMPPGAILCLIIRRDDHDLFILLYKDDLVLIAANCDDFFGSRHGRLPVARVNLGSQSSRGASDGGGARATGSQGVGLRDRSTCATFIGSGHAPRLCQSHSATCSPHAHFRGGSPSPHDDGPMYLPRAHPESRSNPSPPRMLPTFPKFSRRLPSFPRSHHQPYRLPS